MIHHRTGAFRKTCADVARMLGDVMRTAQSPCIITGSGTAAFEAGLSTTVAPGSRMLNINNGKFAERWGKQCMNLGLDVLHHQLPWGTHITPDAMRSLLGGEKVDAVIITHSETSTATACDLQPVAAVVRELAPDALLMVDGITSIGALPFDMDGWGVDVAVTGSQKALMLPPGLGFVALSDRAWQAAERNRGRKPFYLDLMKYRDGAGQGDSPFTPAIPQIRAAEVSLKMMLEEGLESIWRRTAEMASYTRDAATEMGLTVYSRQPSDSVTAIELPGDADAIRKQLLAEHNVQLAGGQGELTGRIVRVSHMGYVSMADMKRCMAALKQVLAR